MKARVDPDGYDLTMWHDLNTRQLVGLVGLDEKLELRPTKVKSDFIDGNRGNKAK